MSLPLCERYSSCINVKWYWFVFQEEFLEGIHYGRELAEISKCHNNESLVLLNIRRVHLIKLDMSTKVRKLVHSIDKV